MKLRVGLAAVLLLAAAVGSATGAAPAPVGSAEKSWRQVHPRWRRAFILSFRSLDLLSNEADEQWGVKDGRLVSGNILTDFPLWLQEQKPAVNAARAEGRPILLSLHTHGGYGTGIVTYTQDLKLAQVANYPWLVRQLIAAGLGGDDVTVAIDTCNAQATAAHQLRPDLIRAGVDAWPVFAKWRAAEASRKGLPVRNAYRLFAQDRVRAHLAAPARGTRRNVKVADLEPLTPEERGQFRARMYGPKGVIFGTPAFFNLLRLGLDTRGTLTADLLNGPLERVVLGSLLPQNTAEFRKFREFAYLDTTGVGNVSVVVAERSQPQVVTKPSDEPAPAAQVDVPGKEVPSRIPQ
ncbi:MAG TPA: hypothetical protein VK689_19560 [Armatimonadota bacterium]|nr:hypothetical protein [Armatimonadota bacterium]